ncbi:MAG: hypothetical protein IJU79_05140 [Desulfovibrionaceae bacterium]|nr:hypothetical protein [Desulfovibrionaceae bacterium]
MKSLDAWGSMLETWDVRVVSASWANVRLDVWVKEQLPGLGLRGSRRLLAQEIFLVNGRVGTCAQRLKALDRITVKLAQVASGPRPAIVSNDAELCVFYKPRQLHTVHLAGTRNPSLEAFLPTLCPHKLPTLLQRLDFWTSGLIAAAYTEGMQAEFIALEEQGLVVKKYLALLQGHLLAPTTVSLALDTTRKVVRTRAVLAPKIRETHFVPLAYVDLGTVPPWLDLACEPQRELTLAGCTIYKGARHQIRVHAKSLGHPLWGDEEYGGAFTGSGFYLHHATLFLSRMRFACLPVWLKKEQLLPKVCKWLTAPQVKCQG